MVIHEPSAPETVPVDLPPEMGAILASFAPPLSRRVWGHALPLALGAILATGRRTATTALRILGRNREAHFTIYPRVPNRVAWPARAASRILLGPIVAALIPADWPIVLGADDTVERRTGRRIKARGCSRDAGRSSRKVLIKCFGLKWVAMMVRVRVPRSGRVQALPFLTVPCWPASVPRRRAHESAIDRVQQMASRVRRRFPGRRVVLVLDGGYAAVKLARACRRHRVTMVGRLRLDAGLYDPPGEPPPGKRGRKPKEGARQVKLAEWAGRPDTPWEEAEVRWHGGEPKLMRLFSRTGSWYTAGPGPVAIRYVLARDPDDRSEDAGDLCTDEGLLPREIPACVVQRWSVGVTFEEARAHLGLETQRQWSDLALGRTTPVLLGLFSVVTLAAARCHEEGLPSAESTAWYAKGEPTFSDCLRLVRQRIWRAWIGRRSAEGAALIQFPSEVVEALIHGLASAA